jgi:uncharacterized membrane protein YvbJ
MINSIISKIKSIDKTRILRTLRKKWLEIFIILICLLLSIGYIVGKEMHSKSYLLSKLEVALKNDDVALLNSLVKVNDKNIDEKLLQPIMEYYKEDSSRVDSTISELKDNLETSDMILEKKKFLFWDRFYINMKTYNIKVESNFSEGTFKINDFDPITTGGEYGGLISGIYKVQGSLQSEYGEIKNSTETLLMNDEKIVLNFSAKKVKVNSQFSDADIYINDENTEMMVRDQKEIGPIPIDGTVTMHLEKDFPWGRIKGEEVKVSDSPEINLNIDMANDQLKSDIKDVITEYYKGVFKALNEEDKNMIGNSTKEAQDKIYGILEQKYFFLKNDYNISEITIVEENNEYSYKDGQFRATIVVDVNYYISKFLGLNKTSNKKSFFTKLIYKEGNWMVEDVENFSLSDS